MPAQTLEPVRTWPDTVPDPTRTLGWDVLLWTARWLRQPDGPDAGAPWRFTDEQVRIVLRWFEINERGEFTRRQGTIRRLKGWGLRAKTRSWLRWRLWSSSARAVSADGGKTGRR